MWVYILNIPYIEHLGIFSHKAYAEHAIFTKPRCQKFKKAKQIMIPGRATNDPYHVTGNIYLHEWLILMVVNIYIPYMDLFTCMLPTCSWCFNGKCWRNIQFPWVLGVKVLVMLFGASQNHDPQLEKSPETFRAFHFEGLKSNYPLQKRNFVWQNVGSYLSPIVMEEENHQRTKGDIGGTHLPLPGLWEE